MKTPILAALAFAILSGAAGAAEPAQSAAPTNPHKAREARFRECTEQADQQRLSGEARRAAIANCMRVMQTVPAPR